MEQVFKASGDGRQVILLGSRSRSGGGGVFPRIPAHSPAAHLYEDIELAGPAQLYSYTVIHPGPKTGKPPFVLILADYPQNARVFGRLDMDPEQVTIGMQVEARANPASDDGSYHFVPAGGN
jgi:uncharacterized OB-fold protein